MRLYKLTDKDGYTRRNEYNETLWGEHVTHKVKGKGTLLCSSDVIHAYTSPYIAVLMNCKHADLNQPKLWLAKGKVVATDHQLKCGVKSLTTIKQIPLPVITLEQKVKIAIYCSLKVYKEPMYVAWAKNWLNGKDRSCKATAVVAAAAAYAAVAAAADAADHAAAAVAAADAAADAAAAAYAADAAAAAYAAAAVAAAADAAAVVAAAAADAAAAGFNILRIINRVIHS
jgi:hypothetical protein